MQLDGARAARAFGAQPDIAEWADRCALNPSRIGPSQRADPAVQAQAARLAAVADDGLAGLAALAGT